MPIFSVIEGKRHHCGQVARKLRTEQAEAVIRFGVQTHRRLVEVFDSSSWSRAWLADGRVIGLGGLQGPLASSEAVIWLALSQEACRYPVAMLKEARRQLAEVMQTRRKIVTTLFKDDPASQRFASHLGFDRCGDPVEHNGQVILPVSIWR